MDLQNLEHSLQKSARKPSIASAVSSSVSDTVQYSAQGNDNFHSQGSKQAPNSANSSFSSPAVTNPVVRAVNNMPPADGAFNKRFRLRPPHPAPSNQFSYVQSDQRVQSHRDIPPPSHPNRFHVPNSENGNFYREHDRMKLAPVDIGERWRTPPFHGKDIPQMFIIIVCYRVFITLFFQVLATLMVLKCIMDPLHMLAKFVSQHFRTSDGISNLGL